MGAWPSAWRCDAEPCRQRCATGKRQGRCGREKRGIIGQIARGGCCQHPCHTALPTQAAPVTRRFVTNSLQLDRLVRGYYLYREVAGAAAIKRHAARDPLIQGEPSCDARNWAGLLWD